MDVDAGAFVRVLGEHARDQWHAEMVKHVGQALQRDDEHAGVGEDNFLHVARGRVATEGGGDIGLDDFAQRGELFERGVSEFAGTGGGVGVAREAQTFSTSEARRNSMCLSRRVTWAGTSFLARPRSSK